MGLKNKKVQISMGEEEEEEDLVIVHAGIINYI
jgi:hypothetical protein